jgi:hypothetical protein
MPTTTGRTRSPSSRPLTSTRSGVDERHFSTLNADGRSEFSTPRNQGSRRLTSTRSNADKMSGFSMPDVDEMHFSTPRPGGPSRQAEARQTQNKLKGSKVYPRRLRKSDRRRGVRLKGPFDRGRKLTYLELSTGKDKRVIQVREEFDLSSLPNSFPLSPGSANPKRVEGVQVLTAPQPLPLRGCMEKLGLLLSSVPTTPHKHEWTLNNCF